ncbi:hypothetical protein FrEUN1fDRAFT_7182 [Parafrankia sp. EUN1f]|nr:hypothetical protein FrEUN1fDRAFT_7182 [Parafrankia sp. EUN1f]
MDLFAKFSDWHLHAPLRNIFVGVVPAIQPNALASAIIDDCPCIAISAGLLSSLDQCLVLWESVYRVLAETITHPAFKHMTDREAMDLYFQKFHGKGVGVEMAKANSLRRLLLNADPEFIKEALADPHGMEPPAERVPTIDRLKQPRRRIASLGFVVAHELAHVLLGHVCHAATRGYAEEKLARHREVIDRLPFRNSSQRDEVDADLFGFHEILLGSFREKATRVKMVPRGERDRQYAAMVGQCLEGAAIATLALHLVGSAGEIPTGISTHPAPAIRIQALCDAAQDCLTAVLSRTSEPDVGPRGPGYLTRAAELPRTIHSAYEIVASVVDSAK